MGLVASQIDGLVAFTQEDLIKRGAFLDLMSDLSDFVAVREIWKSHQKKFAGGLDWRFDVIMDQNHSARVVGLYETDGSSINDSQTSGKVGPRFLNASYTYDILEPIFQSPSIQIVDYVKSKYTRMMQSFYELAEEILWSKPVDSTDLKTPYGLAYWIVKNATEGFNGGNPAGFADGRAGINTTTYPRWANYTASYTDISKADLIRKIRKCLAKINFVSPLSQNQPTLGATKNGIYAPYTVVAAMEEILETQNMSLGSDVASQDGKVMIKGKSLTYAPKLDEDSTEPIYFVDWAWMCVGVLEGWAENVGKPTPVAGKRTVRRVDLDASMNMVCTNLRRQAVMYRA